MFKKYKILNFTGRINAFRVIKRHEILNILGGQNTESVNYDVNEINLIIQYFSKFHTT